VLQGFTPDEVWGKVVQKIREVCFPYRPCLPNVNVIIPHLLHYFLTAALGASLQ
jgi:hypothetical protein